MSKLFIVINVDWFFLSHRKGIAIAAQKSRYDVVIVTNNTGSKETIENLGLQVLDLPMDRTGTNIWKEFKTFIYLFTLYLRQKPALVHHVGLKLVLIGGLAAKFAQVNGVVNAISGMGISFSDENLKSGLTRFLLRILRISHNRKQLKVIFQNKEDQTIFIKNQIIKENQSVLVKGSGIDLREFNYTTEPITKKIKIIFTARMIIEKGVLELIEAANYLKPDYYSKIQFLLCGGIDVNPKAIKEKELRKHCDGDYIVWLGHRSDVKELLESSHIVAFPSYYKEGLPKSLIEACAIGRPIITTNSVGCKDVVEDGYNGFLIPVKDSLTLAEKLKQLIDDKELRIKFGKNSRIVAERDFSIENVIDKHLEIYSEFSSK